MKAQRENLVKLENNFIKTSSKTLSGYL